MDKRTTSIIAYITFVGLIVAICAGDMEGAKFHINQALVIQLFGLLSFIPFIGFFWSIFILVLWVIGLVHAINQEETPVPLFGTIQIIK